MLKVALRFAGKAEEPSGVKAQESRRCERNKIKICHKNHLGTEEMLQWAHYYFSLQKQCFTAASTSFTVPESITSRQKHPTSHAWVKGPFPKYGQEKAIYLSFLAFVVVGTRISPRFTPGTPQTQEGNAGKPHPYKRQMPHYKHCIFNQDLQKKYLVGGVSVLKFESYYSYI